MSAATHVAERLAALSQCEDIPAARRRELMRLAEELRPESALTLALVVPSVRVDPFIDRWFAEQRAKPKTMLMLGKP